MIDLRSALDNRQLVAALFVLAVGTASIGSAWGFQLIGGYLPCKLCLEQRIPYYIGLPIALITAALAAWMLPRWPSRIGLILIAAIMAYGLYLAVYQAGAEWEFWPGPDDCGATGQENLSTGNLLSELKSMTIVSCTEVSWRMVGLSFAGWNAVICALIVVASLWGALTGSRANR